MGGSDDVRVSQLVVCFSSSMGVCSYSLQCSVENKSQAHSRDLLYFSDI